MDLLMEAIHSLEKMVLVNRKITAPFLKKKSGLTILKHGNDFGEIVTHADVGISQALLNGVDGVSGFRKRYPGSFSEEEDTLLRAKSLEIIQVDPIDGTGDLVATYQSNAVTPATTLVSKLSRISTGENYKPVWGIIFDIVNEIALVSDGEKVILCAVNEDGILQDIPYATKEPEKWDISKTIYINKRTAYPQNNFDTAFMDFLKKHGFRIQQVHCGGAGIFALQVFRGILEAEGCRAFQNLQPLTIGFNAQPDWKTWDTDPTEIIANALGFPQRSDIFGNSLSANVAKETLKEMHHTRGYVLSSDAGLQRVLCALATEFTEKHPDLPLTAKNY